MHDAYISRCSENNIKYVLHDDLGQKNQTTAFTSDFLSFIVVEHIRFFHGAVQLPNDWP